MKIFSKLFGSDKVKQQEKQVEVLVPVTTEISARPHSSYPKEVYEIHHAFETAGDKILAEAQCILKECEGKSIEKGKRLIQLGFKQAKESVIAKEIITQTENAESISQMVIYFKVNYPNNKFITEKQVEEICKKWGLVCASVNSFKGFVPEKNLIEIEKFRLKVKDIPQVEIRSRYGEPLGFTKIDDVCGYYSDIHRQQNEWHHVEYVGPHENLKGGEEKWGQYSQFKVLADKPEFKICAPLKDMDTAGMELHGYKLYKHIPDPIVLQPVIGGALIVTAWGDEASDENVVNQAMN